MQAATQHRAVWNAAHARAQTAALKNAGAALDVLGEVYDAGQLDVGGLIRTDGYQPVDELDGTSTFTSCLDDEHRLAGGLPA